MPDLDVILPTLDEEAALPWVLERMPTGCRALVVDNGSTDRSAEVARELGATVVDAPQRGFGAACWAGLQAAEAEVVAFMDADASLDPGDLALVTGPVLTGESDLVVGARQAAPGSWPPHARLANRVLATQVRRKTGLALDDLGPMRAGRREDLLALGIEDRRSGWPLEMVLRAQNEGWRVVGVPVPYHPREGRSKVTGTVKGTITAVQDMSKILRRL
ncbi:glycosyltransferase family 2 protein [soil metagenome]